MRNRIRWTAVTALAVALLGIAGCGGEDKQGAVEKQTEAADAAWLKQREVVCRTLNDAEACAEAEELRRGEERPVENPSPTLRRHERELKELEARCRQEPDNPELVC